jgi:hypothetical protein
MGQLIIAMVSAAVFAQQPAPEPSAIDHRGAMAMGFDQHATTHHFRLYADGGAIEVSANDAADAASRAAIRMHLSHIAGMFAAGNFDAPMLVHDTTAVPGIAVMAERKQAIGYQYLETASGGRVTITTIDPEALRAVHAFLRYQITEHKTGDPVVVQTK